MYLQAIRFRPKLGAPGIDERDIYDSVTDLLIYFAASLKNNGQILPGYTIAEKSGDYYIYATAPKRDSLNRKHDGIYVRRDRKFIDERFTVSVRTLGKNTDSQEYCECKRRTAIEMQTFSCHDIDSVFTCCDCGKPIALYELPLISNQNDYYPVVSWQGSFRAVDYLWFECLSDRFTGNQLVNLNSTLNKCGLSIAREMEQKTGCTVYYNVYDDLTSKVKFVKCGDKELRICPSCGKPMQYVKFSDDYKRYVCKECKLTSNLFNGSDEDD